MKTKKCHIHRAVVKTKWELRVSRYWKRWVHFLLFLLFLIRAGRVNETQWWHNKTPIKELANCPTFLPYYVPIFSWPFRLLRLQEHSALPWNLLPWTRLLWVTARTGLQRGCTWYPLCPPCRVLCFERNMSGVENKKWTEMLRLKRRLPRNFLFVTGILDYASDFLGVRFSTAFSACSRVKWSWGIYHNSGYSCLYLSDKHSECGYQSMGTLEMSSGQPLSSRNHLLEYQNTERTLRGRLEVFSHSRPMPDTVLGTE